MMLRPIGQIAQDIVDDITSTCRDKRKPLPPYVNGYVRPMVYLDTVTDNYGADDGEYVVIYALSNLSTYRGPKAKGLKDELKAHLYAHNPTRYKAYKPK
jgi:hypothetical protein